MAETRAKPAIGTVLKIDVSASLTAVVDARNIQLSGRSRSLPQVTPINADSNAEEYIGCEYDEGEITFELNYNPTNSTHTTIRDNFAATAPITVAVQYPQYAASPNAPTFSCEAWCSQFALQAQNQQQLVANVTFKFTSAGSWGTS